MTHSARNRPIRSYVLRAGRMTEAQQRGYDEGWGRFGIDYDARMLDIDACFGRSGRRVLEIGFGMGQSLVEMAAADPAANFIGVEVHRPGVGKLLHGMAEQGLGKIRVYCHDAVEVLENCIPPGSLDTVQIFFPDPWHKKRHHKRRLIQPPFVELLCSRLRPGGVLHLATDWENYAEQMLEVLDASAALENLAGAGQYSPRPDYRPLTKFERRGERLGHGVWDLLYARRQ
jgi:tRNA (guanine-N7-)-methyltransferase